MDAHGHACPGRTWRFIRPLFWLTCFLEQFNSHLFPCYGWDGVLNPGFARTRKELLLFFFFRQTFVVFCGRNNFPPNTSKCKSHHAMRHAAVAPETPDRYRNWRPQCCTRPWTLFIVFINMKTLGTVSYAASLRSVIPSVHERLFLSIFKRTFESWKKCRESRSSRRHQWKRARRFHERWLFEGRMSSLLFTDDGCYSSFIQRLTSGRY